MFRNYFSSDLRAHGLSPAGARALGTAAGARASDVVLSNPAEAGPDRAVNRRNLLQWLRARCFPQRTSTYDLTSANIMHWGPAMATGKAGEGANTRAVGLADYFAGHDRDFIIVQEAFPRFVQEMQARGYLALLAEKGDQGTLVRAHQDDGRSGQSGLVQAWDRLWHWKLGYTGLVTFSRSDRLHMLGQPEFRRYQAQAHVLSSPSGSLRTDGLQVVKTKDASTGDEYILCNTHLESFDQGVCARQVQELIGELRQLRQEHPRAVIQLGGDFNCPQGPLIERFNKELGALSFAPEQATVPTFKKRRIDGLFALVPPHLRVLRNDCATVPHQGLSDHKFVSQHLELGRRLPWRPGPRAGGPRS